MTIRVAATIMLAALLIFASSAAWAQDAPVRRVVVVLAPYLTWVSGGLSAYNVSSHYVRAYVWAGYDGGSVKVSKLRLHYQYGLLK